jgi:hypothetical protein
MIDKKSEEWKAHLREIGFKKGGDARRSQGRLFFKGHTLNRGRKYRRTINLSGNLGKYSQKGCPSWSKGLTKEIDERVRKLSVKRTDEFKNNLSRLKLGVPREYMRGEKNPNWHGGTSKNIDIRLRTLEWKQLRKEFLTKFKECQFCGSIKNLQVHHIIPYEIYPYNNRIFLIMLCRHCHAKDERMADKLFRRKKFKKINREWESGS